MKHVMALHNARTGHHYALELTQDALGWEAVWRTLDGNGAPVPDGPAGRLGGSDPERVFDAVCTVLESHDEDVVGGDWAFEAPVPPWLNS